MRGEGLQAIMPSTVPMRNLVEPHGALANFKMGSKIGTNSLHLACSIHYAPNGFRVDLHNGFHVDFAEWSCK